MKDLVIGFEGATGVKYYAYFTFAEVDGMVVAANEYVALLEGDKHLTRETGNMVLDAYNDVIVPMIQQYLQENWK